MRIYGIHKDMIANVPQSNPAVAGPNTAATDPTQARPGLSSKPDAAAIDSTQRLHMESMGANKTTAVNDTTKAASSEELKGLDWLSWGWNKLKQLGRGACLAGGFISATGAVVSMFFLNIKTLGVLFAIPTILFLYTAVSLGRGIKKDPRAKTQEDPLGAVNNIINNNLEALRENPKEVIAAIDSMRHMSKDHPQYAQAMERLLVLREVINTEKQQLMGMQDELSLQFSEYMDNYLSSIEKVLAESHIVAPQLQPASFELQQGQGPILTALGAASKEERDKRQMHAVPPSAAA